MSASLHHIGIVVDDLETAGGFVEDVLGAVVTRRIALDSSTRAAFFSLPGWTLELIEVGDEAVRRQRLGPAGTAARIEHLAIQVNDLDAAVAEYGVRGVTFVQSPQAIQATTEAREVGGVRTLFTRPDTSAGFSLQLLELDDAA